MSLDALMTESVTILRRTVTGVDSTGDAISKFVRSGKTRCYTEDKASAETIVGRDQVVADREFVLPSGTVLEPYDRLLYAGVTFEVVGLPARLIRPGHGEHHVVAQARVVEG